MTWEPNTEHALRIELAAAYRILDHLGLTTYLQNHVTVRIAETNQFLINPYGLSYDEVTASSLVRIDLAGTVVEPGRGPFGRSVNPAGFVLHRSVHQARKDAGCVVHVHTVAGTAVSAMKEGLLPISIEAMQIGDVGYHDFEGLTLELDECARIAANLGDRRVLVLRNHGLLTVGRTVAEALATMLFLERACQVQLAACSSGRALIEVERPIATKVAEQARSFVASGIDTLTFESLLRRIDKLDPSYRD